MMDDQTITLIAVAVAAVSELLALIPAVKANGIFQAVFLIVRRLAGK